jgi:ATP-binding protein involved in chromosome partitioning
MVTNELVKEKLSNVIYPGFKKSIVEFGFVKHINCDDGIVHITIKITSSVKEVEDALKLSISKELDSLDAKDIHIHINKPKPTEIKKDTPKVGQNITPQIKEFIMISSGKGGVGKSTTSVNLAIALASQGKKVGLLDADIYGPNIPRMMGLEGQEVKIVAGKVMPFKVFGVEMMSMGSIVSDGTALVWRGAMVQKAITQLLQDILWSELDCLIIDMPPGTGDAQLTLAQSVPVSAGINVTTPQQVALDDSRRSLEMFEKLNIPVAGIIENMSGFVCPSCNNEYDIFGSGTCDKLAKEYNTQVLATIPIEPSIREGGDEGKPVAYFYPDSITGKKYQIAAKYLWENIQQSQKNNKISNENIQPGLNSAVGAAPVTSSSCKTDNSGCGCG